MGARGMSGDGDGEGTMEATRMVRRRRPGVAALLALGVIGLALAIVAGRPGPGPVLATVAVGFWGVTPTITVDEVVGRAYVPARVGSGGGGVGGVQVVDTATGAVVGTVTLPGQNGGALVVAVDGRRGRAYAATNGGTRCGSTGSGLQTCTAIGAAVVALDARTGQSLPLLSVDAGHGLSIDARTGLLYALPSGGTVGGGAPTVLRAHDPHTGRVVRTIALRDDSPNGGVGALAIDGRGVGALAIDGRGVGALAIDGRGRMLVAVRVAFRPVGTATVSVDVVDLTRGRLVGHIVLPSAGFIAAYRPPLLDAARGRAYIGLSSYGSGPAQVAVIDTGRGTLVRDLATGVGFGTIAEDTRTGRVFATALGAVRTVTTRTPGGGTGTRQIPGGVGGLRVLDARSGTLLQRVPIGVGTTDVVVDERRGRVYALNIGPADARGGLTHPGTLSVVDERSGRVMRTLAVGAVPVTLALDRRHDRLLVGCYGAVGGTPNDPWAWVPSQVRRLLPVVPRPTAPSATPQGSVMVLDTTRL